MQNDLVLHMYFAPKTIIPKYNNVLTRTDLFSLRHTIERKARRIELCRRFSLKAVMMTVLNDFTIKMSASE